MRVRIVALWAIVLACACVIAAPRIAGAQADWKKTWEAAGETARKEGEVTIYGPHNPVYQQVWAIFQKSYSEIKFSFVPGKGSDHAQRIVAERRAGKYLADLLMGGSSTYASFAPGTLEPMRPLLILPEVTDMSAWFDGKPFFADPQDNAGLIISGEIGGAPAVVIPKGQFFIVIGGEKADIDPVVRILNDVAQTIICLPEPWMPKAFKIAIILYATTNNIISAEICSWLTAQGADPKLFLKLLQTTGSEASAARMEEFMKRNNNHGGALSNSYKDFRQALQIAAKLEIPMPLASMANQIQEMARASGLIRFNSPAAMGKLYELLTGTDLSGASVAAEKKVPPAREPQIVFLDDVR